MRRIVLASGSPRRKMLLEQIGLKFEIVKSDFKEKVNSSMEPGELVKFLSMQKAKIVGSKYKNSIIVAADTIIVLNNEIIGKPKTEKEAIKILRLLSGKAHTVITGLTVLDSTNNKAVTKSVETKVFFRKLKSSEIENYIKLENTLDKAGAYGIQGIGSLLIEKIEGDYFNVVGLPLSTLHETLKNFGVNLI